MDLGSKQGQADLIVIRHFSRVSTFVWLSFAFLMIGGKLYQAFWEPTRCDVMVLFMIIGVHFICTGGYYAYIASIAAKTLTAYRGNKRFLIMSIAFMLLLGCLGIASGSFSFYVWQHPNFVM